MKYSIIVPVYNRPDEVDELLQSLTEQELKDFEVVIVEDGSQKPCKDVCDKFADILDLHYYVKENGGERRTGTGPQLRSRARPWRMAHHSGFRCRATQRLLESC